MPATRQRPGDRAACAATKRSISVAQMNAQPKVLGDYRPGPRPQTRAPASNYHGRDAPPPERNREWSTGPQPKPTGTRLAAQSQAALRQEGSLMPTVTVGQENNTDIEIHYED